jgi:N-ethylmaleimide reductase
MRADFYQQQTGDVLTPIRENYQGVLIGNMGYDAKEAEKAVATGKLDAVSFGVSFIANPDLPERIKVGGSLNQPNPETFYSFDEKGYTDYPFVEDGNLNQHTK